MLLIPLLFVCTTLFSLNIVFFILRRAKGSMTSNVSFLLGLGISIVSFIIFSSLASKNWNGIDLIGNVYVLYLSVLIIPGTVGIIGVFIPQRFKIINTIGFAFAFSAVLSGILSIPYLFSV